MEFEMNGYINRGLNIGDLDDVVIFRNFDYNLNCRYKELNGYYKF